MKKKATRAEKIYMSKVADLGCIACSYLGFEGTQAEIHHIATGGKGRRASNYDVIPLCPHHHRTGGHGEAIHAGRETSFCRKRKTR